jgi:hypothetical protein
MLDGELREMMGKPGPPEYDVITKPGSNSKIKHGTLYDISVKAKIEHRDNAGAISPGPARYNHKAGFETKGLWEKIKARKAPRDKYWRRYLPEDRRQEIEAAEAEENADAGEEDYEGRRRPVRSQSTTNASSHATRTGKLPRVDSSPM